MNKIDVFRIKLFVKSSHDKEAAKFELVFSFSYLMSCFHHCCADAYDILKNLIAVLAKFKQSVVILIKMLVCLFTIWTLN